MTARSHLQPVPDPPGSEGTGRGGNGGRFESRLTRLETHFSYLATKEDLQKLKVWWLIGIITGMGLAAGMALTFLKVFANPN